MWNPWRNNMRAEKLPENNDRVSEAGPSPFSRWPWTSRSMMILTVSKKLYSGLGEFSPQEESANHYFSLKTKLDDSLEALFHLYPLNKPEHSFAYPHLAPKAIRTPLILKIANEKTTEHELPVLVIQAGL